MQIKDVWQCCYGHDNGWQVLFNTIEDDRVAKRCTDLLNRNCQAETKFLLETPDLSTYGIRWNVCWVEYNLDSDIGGSCYIIDIRFENCFISAWNLRDVVCVW